MDELKVNINANEVGMLLKENDEYIFSYKSDTNPENFLSLVMQVRQKPFIHKKLHPIFEMHL
ncbi:MAG: HipA N-terminal domain-containing protein [Sulfurimonadaceae bacterium]|jgi:serine/threonine-protein kinase HipA|nr:HipA N-terminal domain-containing protein [Sulfurimonadaceae bacterium]